MLDLQKTFVLDTNVLVHRPDACLSFPQSEVVIPLWVFEELDGLKKDHTDRGRNAREAIRVIEKITNEGRLQEGVLLENGSTLRIIAGYNEEGTSLLPPHLRDNKIILCALTLHKEKPSVFFVSKDINARIKASVLGITAIDYEAHKVNIDSLYSGVHEASVESEAIEELLNTGSLTWKEALNPNEFVLLSDQSPSERSGRTVHIGRYRAETRQLEHVESSLRPVMGIHSLNVKQRIAFELLLDPSLPLVTLVGRAGTGKTLLALAAGLKQTLLGKTYVRLLVSRPVVPLGRDIGYLPGAKLEKMRHWMQPISDNLELIIGEAKQQNLKSVDQLLLNNKIMEVEALTYIRGRSLPRQYVIIDEAQNLTPHEIKTIVSRAGEGTKVVLTGDPFQIDSPYLDEASNGLTYLVDAFRSQNISGHVTLAKSERSPLAELATELL